MKTQAHKIKTSNGLAKQESTEFITWSFNIYVVYKTLWAINKIQYPGDYNALWGKLDTCKHMPNYIGEQ